MPIADELGQASGRWQRPVLLTEVGFTSQFGTATSPATWTLSSQAAPDQQARGYRAVLDVFSARQWWEGVSWWAWRADGTSEPLGFSPQDSPAAQLLSQRWAGAVSQR